MNASGTDKVNPCAPQPGRGLGLPSARQSRRAYIGLGSNINPVQNMICALQKLAEQVSLERVAQTWETPAVGSHGPNFLNTAAAIQTQLSAELLKSLVLRRIERELGRTRTGNKYAARTIDLDILVYEEQVLDPSIWTQAFLAVPLAELLPGLWNPLQQETFAQTAQRLAAQTPLKLRSEVPSGEYNG